MSKMYVANMNCVNRCGNSWNVCIQSAALLEDENALTSNKGGSNKGFTESWLILPFLIGAGIAVIIVNNKRMYYAKMESIMEIKIQ